MHVDVPRREESRELLFVAGREQAVPREQRNGTGLGRVLHAPEGQSKPDQITDGSGHDEAWLRVARSGYYSGMIIEPVDGGAAPLVDRFGSESDMSVTGRPCPPRIRTPEHLR